MNWTSRKKRAEMEVLRMVYDLKPFEPVEASERPDFELCRSAESEPFGVEVTRLYQSEASARLEHIRGYVSELIGGGKHRHKDDVRSLVVDNFTLTKADGTVPRVIRGIMEALPPIADHIRMIAERIEAKSGAFSGGRADLTHVNLILLDKTGRFRSVSPENVARLLFKKGVCTALATTCFREVFYVAEVHESRKVFFPLRMLLLVSDLFMFNAARTDFDNEDVKVQSRDEELTLFGSFMCSRGVPVLLTGGTANESVQVLFGNSGVFVVDDSVTMRDYTDWPLPQARTPPDRAFSEEFLTFYDQYSEEHVFDSGLVFDVRK